MDFRRLQHAFTANIRDPERVASPPDVDPSRMAVYQRLVFNNIDSYMSRAFSAVRAFFGEAEWHALVRGFFVLHRCRKPQFFESAEEFLDYLQTEARDAHGEPLAQFLLELAHFEWLRMMLYVQSDPDLSAAGAPDNQAIGPRRLLVSPLAYPLSYQYPVHALTPGELPAEPAAPTFLIVYRELAGEEAVRVMQMNAVTAMLLEHIDKAPSLRADEHLAAIAETLGHAQTEQVIAGGMATLRDLCQRGVVLAQR
ncbi:putative DNA-binding domain-containing protein [Methylonatrum kenyense]|uniref:HvfC family RiPP maturation protein n=1 Tax=Methylonatrum kenyense TaxID=455253 RepID=UPI0020BF6B93|nr:putative DNA-binding domain-containing protein [Methylonatrum kenyense]MCK8515164.1 putative DNA-binding domain-containing protein [Methylonatrum kenyense]